ncbi:hypothetical protein RRG08_015445 [Elysia crispata]|uniref:Uncharacterized protein n=1 Tax=Elysia crispata TaxID=231223 RepID=A0AAE0YHG5_9GAST|nr:hypothetical protein RRG08_015445 [Elysia crispata]
MRVYSSYSALIMRFDGRTLFNYFIAHLQHFLLHSSLELGNIWEMLSTELGFASTAVHSYCWGAGLYRMLCGEVLGNTRVQVVLEITFS